ncbi:MAG: CRISPR-associated protein Cas1 [Candidatus Methanohalarchaeum thermophilum]|uniref:CRISPR-associated endonuclease Cas1 n=1 Tax=Methanohalarchaeum thermophilum TaxID=1903181 RepID=A0A1Q6DWT3_METT1|nr:MAG: CRISPR-associated protein Cas1 [Candidatus Methanohalarchaeum thermophilum]
MKRNFYINSDGKLRRKENTVYHINEDGDQKPIPIEKIYSIYSYGSLTYTSQCTHLLAKEGVPIHFFNYYGYYDGSFYPKETYLSGKVTVNQAEHYLKQEKRLELAKKFVKGSIENIKSNLKRYNKNKKLEVIEDIKNELKDTQKVTEVMNIEGRCRSTYYKSFDEILPEKFKYTSRSRQPPKNMVNCLLSFGNSLLYSTTISEIYNSQLDPTISYLHEPRERRFSLALDIADVFKPLIVDRTIFYLTNKGMLDKKHFDDDLNKCLLNEEGRKKFEKRYEKTLNRTIKHREIQKKCLIPTFNKTRVL